jgi:hypothetical protein
MRISPAFFRSPIWTIKELLAPAVPLTNQLSSDGLPSVTHYATLVDDEVSAPGAVESAVLDPLDKRG